MNLTDLLADLARKGVQISVDGDNLRFRAPKGALSPALVQELARRKTEIMLVLRSSGNQKQSHADVIQRTTREAPLPLSEVQQDLWLVEQLASGHSARQITAGFRLKGKLHLDALEKSIRELVRRHEILRTTFAVREGQPVQIIGSDDVCDFSIVDLEETALKPYLRQEANRPFDLDRGPLFRIVVVRLSSSEHVLYLIAHHLIFDVESVWLFVRELFSAGAGYDRPQTGGHRPPLQTAIPPIQYADFAASPRPVVSENDLSYWKRQLTHAPVLELPTDRSRQ